MSQGQGSRRKAPEASHPRAPLVPDVGVIALVPDRWDDFWQTRHYVLARLARYFHVIWCNPEPGNGHGHPSDGTHGAPPPGLIVHDPPRWTREMNRPRCSAD